MSFCRFLSLVLVLVLAPVVSACASSSDAPFSEDAERAIQATGGQLNPDRPSPARGTHQPERVGRGRDP